jgi:hypothetical protein
VVESTIAQRLEEDAGDSQVRGESQSDTVQASMPLVHATVVAVAQSKHCSVCHSLIDVLY